MTDFLSEAASLQSFLQAVRQTLHRAPELGNQEIKTSAYLKSILEPLGLTVENPFGTALCATLHGAKPGRTAALRADMDALAVTEATGAEFSSRTPGVMHACGHDIHMTAAVGAAMLLAAHRETLCGSIRFLFQPDEEGCGGAQRFVDAGCLRGVDAVFGAHVSPELPLGSVGIRYGKFYAASDTFSITVRGKSAHGAEPEKGIDALQAAAQLAIRLVSLRTALNGERCAVTVGTLQAGTAINVVADTAQLTGILRTLGPDSRARMRRLVTDAAAETAAQTGTQIDVQLHESYPGIVNDDGASRLVHDTAVQLLGEPNVAVLQQPMLMTEDFGYYLSAARGCFYHVGAGCAAPLHSPQFLPDIRAAVTAAALHAAVLERALAE